MKEELNAPSTKPRLERGGLTAELDNPRRHLTEVLQNKFNVNLLQERCSRRKGRLDSYSISKGIVLEKHWVSFGKQLKQTLV